MSSIGVGNVQVIHRARACAQEIAFHSPSELVWTVAEAGGATEYSADYDHRRLSRWDDDGERQQRGEQLERRGWHALRFHGSRSGNASDHHGVSDGRDRHAGPAELDTVTCWVRLSP